MTVFLAAVETGSLSAAGRRLGMPLATVSRKLSELESHLKTRLLNRSTRKLGLTDAGRAYLIAAKRILDDVGEAERAAAGEFLTPTGELAITAPIVFGRLHVVPIATEFLKAYRQVDLRLMLGDRLANLHEDAVDLAVRIGHLPDSRLTATRVGTIRRVLCASPAYLAERGRPATPQDLRDHDGISFEVLMSGANWDFRIAGKPLAVPVRARLAVNTAEAAIDAAIAGVGIARVLSYQVEAARRAGQLEILLPEAEPEPLPVSLVYAGGRRLALKLRAFVDFAAPRLRERLAGVAP